MTLELHQNLTDVLISFCEQYAIILQRELEIEGLLPQSLLEKGSDFINRLLDLQLETKYFNNFKEKKALIHTVDMCFQIDNDKIQSVFSSVYSTTDRQEFVSSYIQLNLSKFQIREENKLTPFSFILPFKEDTYTTLFGYIYLDGTTESLWILIYDFNFHFSPDANHTRNIGYFNLKLMCATYYKEDPKRVLDLDEHNLENYISQSYPNLISKFRIIIGLTLKEYHFHQRMNLVLQKLYFEDKAIKEIAIDLNYNSDNTLYGDISKHFKHNSSEIKRYNYTKAKDLL
ncbi:helix-turn-helix transcriptional regulator [Myroides guanonis]|uniref:AraC-type DNA-binding protein n=1 Tax=Myroides guanonis TaxID=1150112 RepID=A0A1I3R2J8_9FLAO|nr:AraC family transcriptional regulator [Myroides guanonis]SFJ39701.1 AraC-type DNA-binding protein [Myroides guanonis]